MNQEKIGLFLKQLRKEKNLTQEQLAEKFYVSPRTVSRWETGSNLPDLSILIDLADYYNVDVREIINGERKEEKMTNETHDTLKKVAEYANEENKKFKKKILDMLVVASLLLVFMAIFSTSDKVKEVIPDNIYNIILELSYFICCVFISVNIMYHVGVFEKIISRKNKK